MSKLPVTAFRIKVLLKNTANFNAILAEHCIKPSTSYVERVNNRDVVHYFIWMKDMELASILKLQFGY